MAHSAASTTCPHVSSILNDTSSREGPIKKYTSVVSWYTCRSQPTRPAKRRKIAAPSCGTCDIALSRPMACLHCAYNGCWNDGHISQHLRANGHTFCIDSKTGYVFCSDCNDFIYDSKLEENYLVTTLAAEEKLTKFKVSQKTRESYRRWTPTDKENTALESVEPIPCQGRRGLLNLGQTCFLNAVLQCLVHNPLLRNYFLSDKHNHRTCKAENCCCCEMDKLFTEVYSDDSTPYGPVSFLATTWKASSELSGYAQQDAHEFFMSTLNQIHLTSRGFTNVSCNCVVHSTFAGQLQSDVKCERCGTVTSTVDPMLDVSLELKAAAGRSHGGGAGGGGSAGAESNSEISLAACLRRFTQPEKLGQKEYVCSKCGKATHEASKRLSVRKLPPVLSFQFKRFEHKTNDKSSAKKIDTPVRFPAFLNMAPYTTLAMQGGGGGGGGGGGSASSFGPNALYEYDLFGVICHEGQIDNGHYISYARSEHEWYRFDDNKITHSTLRTCLSSSAYMCFYVKRHLDYKPYVTPSYIVARETEAAREKEMEREREKEELEKEKEKEKEVAARMKEVEDDILATLTM